MEESGHKGNGEKESGGSEKDKQNKIRTADSDRQQSDLYNDLVNPGDNANAPLLDNADDNSNNNLEQERERLASERSTLDEFLDELTTPGTELDEGDLAAYEELEREQLEAEERLRQQEEQVRLANDSLESEIESPEEQPEPESQPPQQPMQQDTIRRLKAKRKRKAPLRLAGSAAKTLAGATLKTAGAVTEASFKTAGAVAGGMLGFSIGLVSGSPDAVFKNTSAGAFTGATTTTGIANRVSAGVGKTSKDIKKAIEKREKARYGEDYDQIMKIKADNEFFFNKEMRKMYKQKLNLNSKEEIDQAMEDAIKYREYGINDNNIIIEAMSMNNGNPANRTEKKRIAAAKLAENSRSEKDLQTNMKRFEKTPGMQKGQIQEMERMVRKINNL